MAEQFQKRSAKEKVNYHSAGERRILAKTQGVGMTSNERDARSAGYMAHLRESTRKYVWANATEAERAALQTLRGDKSKRRQLWDLERSIKARAKAQNEKNKKK